MIQISKEEKEIIQEELPHVHIVRTMRNKSRRHHYFCSEEVEAVRLINKLRGKDKVDKKGRAKRDR